MRTEAITEHFRRVREFMQLAEQATPERPVVPDLKTRKLRAKLILEEALETIEALGLVVLRETTTDDDRRTPLEIDDLTFKEENAPNLVKIADGCADLSVVTVGTLIACGIKDKELLRLVDENNLAKFGPGGYRREDGKWIKPPGHQPPDIAGLIKRQPITNEMPWPLDGWIDPLPSCDRWD